LEDRSGNREKAEARVLCSFRKFESVFVVVVETWAVAAKPVGEVAGGGELDEALKVGFEWARKAARKLAKKGSISRHSRG